MTNWRVMGWQLKVVERFVCLALIHEYVVGLIAIASPNIHIHIYMCVCVCVKYEQAL